MSDVLAETDQAAAAVAALEHGRVVVLDDGHDPVEVPATAVRVLLEALERLRDGKHVHVVADDEEITTQDAAGLLNVSRPYVVSLIEQGVLPCRKVGARRRLRLADVVLYREIERARQTAAVDALANEAQELGLY